MKGVGIGIFVVGIIMAIIIFSTIITFSGGTNQASAFTCEENTLSQINTMVTKMSAPNAQPFNDRLLLQDCVAYVTTSNPSGVRFKGQDANGNDRQVQTFKLPDSVGGQAVTFVNSKEPGASVPSRADSYDVVVNPKARTITIEVQ